jgi:hypothetical protein
MEDYDKMAQELASGPELKTSFRVGEEEVERDKLVSLTINFRDVADLASWLEAHNLKARQFVVTDPIPPNRRQFVADLNASELPELKLRKLETQEVP